MIHKFKIALLSILSLLVLIVVLQNTDSVQTKFLFLTMTMPRAALLAGALVVGFAIGVITAGILMGKKKEKE